MNDLLQATCAICPVCGATNVTAGHVLGHGGATKPKDFSRIERRIRGDRMRAMNAKRRAERCGKLMPNVSGEGRRSEDAAFTD